MNPYDLIKMKDDQAKMRALNENGWCHGHLVIIDRYFLILFKENELIKLGKLRKLCWLIKMSFLRFPFFGVGARVPTGESIKMSPKIIFKVRLSCFFFIRLF